MTSHQQDQAVIFPSVNGKPSPLSCIPDGSITECLLTADTEVSKCVANYIGFALVTNDNRL